MKVLGIVDQLSHLRERESSGSPFDTSLSLHNQQVPFIGNIPVKFLGHRLQVPMDNSAVRSTTHQSQENKNFFFTVLGSALVSRGISTFPNLGEVNPGS